MAFTRRMQHSGESLRSQFGTSFRRALISTLVLVGVVRWLTGHWVLWVAVLPAVVAIWWMWRVARDSYAYLRGRGTPPPISHRW